MNAPILVFGMPRSGTTWVGKLFDSHPDTLYRHEPESALALDVPPFPEVEDAPLHRETLEQFIAALPSSRSAAVVGKWPLFPKDYQGAAGLLAYRASVVVAKLAGRIWKRCPCVYRPTGKHFGRGRLVWKSVVSTGRLGVCARVLSGARVIHVMRHPCGQIASTLRGEAAHRFRQATPTAEDHWVLCALLQTNAGKSRGLNMQDLKRLTPEELLAWRWVLTQEKILADSAQCENVLTVRYEDVCAAPLAATRKMFAFAGLDWSAQAERFVNASTSATDDGYYAVFKAAGVPASHWQSELAPAKASRILGILRGSWLRRYYPEAESIPGPDLAAGAQR